MFGFFVLSQQLVILELEFVFQFVPLQGTAVTGAGVTVCVASISSLLDEVDS